MKAAVRSWPATLAGLLACAALLASVVAAQPARAPAVTVLPLAITVAHTARESEAAAIDERAVGEPAVDDAWLDAQVASANTIFEPHGVRFSVVERHRMGEAHARMETRRDRHSLGSLMHPQRIDCFVVRSLRDVDEPDRYRQGVHWRPRGDGYAERAHFVIVSAIAGPNVLAHELGHYFGNGHSDVPGNIMSYERGEVPPFFDETQAQRIQFSVRRFLRRGELVLAGSLVPRPAPP